MESVDICVRWAQNGDLNAYSELVRCYQDMAVGYAHHLLPDVHLAEDSAQEAFIQVYLHLNDLRQPEPFGTWLRKLVFKYCDRITRQRTRVTEKVSNRAHIQTMSDYERRYRESVEQPEVFWAQIAEDLLTTASGARSEQVTLKQIADEAIRLATDKGRHRLDHGPLLFALKLNPYACE